MSKGLGWDEGVAWIWYILEHLPEKVDTGAVFPLRVLYANLVRRHPVPPDALVCGPHQSDGDPTLDVSARRLHNQKPVNGGEEGREVLVLLEACLQVHLLICPLRLLQTFFRCFRRMGLGICVHDAHVVNTVSPIFLEVVDQEVAPLIN